MRLYSSQCTAATTYVPRANQAKMPIGRIQSPNRSPAQPQKSIDTSGSASAAKPGSLRESFARSLSAKYGQEPKKQDQPASPTNQGDFTIRASRGSDADLAEDQPPQPAQPERQSTAPSGSVGEQQQPLDQREQPSAVSCQLMARPDGSVKLVLFTSEAAAPASEHAPISRRDTPAPVDIPLVEVSLADPAGEHPGHGKSALSRFFHRTRKADDNKPVNMQAIQARRGFSSQLARSMRNLSRSIKRSFRRRDSPPIPVGRHLSKQKGRRRASLDMVDEGVNEGQLGLAGQPDAIRGVVVEPSTGGSASSGHGAVAVLVQPADPAEAPLHTGEPPLPISKNQYPPPPMAIQTVEVSVSSAAVLGPGREAAEAAVAKKYEELHRAGSWAGLEERGKLTGCWGCLFARQLQ